MFAELVSHPTQAQSLLVIRVVHPPSFPVGQSHPPITVWMDRGLMEWL